jgi:RNA polymerase sigma-70 factor (ECF subfamily)
MICTTHDTVTSLILGEEDRLRRLARRLTRCDADADDLVQDTLLRAYRARDRFEPGTSIRAWTATILRRVFLTGVFRTKRRGLETDTDAGEPLDRTAGTAAPSMSDRVPLLHWLLDRLDDPVKHAIEHVPDVYRIPFLLASVEDLTCAEIAERLGVPEGTVMSRIHRARERLKRDLLYERAPERMARLLQPRLRMLPPVERQRVRRSAAG